MHNHVRRVVTVTTLTLIIAVAGLSGAVLPSAVAVWDDGTITITAPADGSTVVRNAPTDVELALTSDLDAGAYELRLVQQPDTDVWTENFEVTDSDISAGSKMLPDLVFPYVGTATLTVWRTDPDGLQTPREFDSVTVSVVSDTPPTPWVVITPGDGSQVPNGFTGPVTVRLRYAPPGDYSLDIQDTISAGNPRKYTFQRTIAHDGSTDKTYSFTVSPFTEIEQHWISVDGGPDSDVYGSTRVDVFATVDLTEAPPHEYRPAEFYPLVRDGLRDSTNIPYRLNVRADLTIRVLNTEGRAVRRVNLGPRRCCSYPVDWDWNGRNNHGETVRPGRYTIRLDAVDGRGYTDTLTRRVKVVTDVVTRSRTLTLRGTATSSRSKAGNCFFNGYAGSLRLDCWGGRYAQGTWTFQVPRTATRLDVSFRGEVGCCDSGQLVRTEERVSATRYRALVRVTDWRAYTVDSVRLSYRYQVRR